MEEKRKVCQQWWFWACIILIICIIIGIIYFINNQGIANTEMTAEEITNKLKEKNSNIGEIVVYTEETDTNELLGRPNSYISKTIFADIRITQPEKMSIDEITNEEYPNWSEKEKQNFVLSNNEPNGGTIEVFNNVEDMQKRKDYLDSLMSSGNVLISGDYAYMYSFGNVLLRIDKSLTPAQAQEYETAFNEIMK